MNLVVYGTRPEEIKLYPFTKYEGYEFLEVNQSKDLHQDLITKKHKCDEDQLEKWIRNPRWKRIIVQGDTRTAFRAAVLGFENKREVVHVEAGMRTYDLASPFPEEGYRQMIDRIATWRFCSTKMAYLNICSEALGGAFNGKNLFVGQTSIDTLFEFYPKDVPEEDFQIVTVHRTESFDKLPDIIETLKKFESKGEKLHVYAHPNKIGQELRKHFDCLEPLPYREFINEMAKCKGFISDSGGLQEEAIALGKRFFCLRDKSERGQGERYLSGATAQIVGYLR